ncbi:MAG: Protein of unknown function (DUF3134) [Phormidesmis priestleyi Ana]|uniref:DUF3134 domain-containing protein n=1 Tax=Phormidesmis priestleyi Ana TaxID=1666911 RepID=A0A0P7ZLQ6_9CYAN|nr:MAG: Protein of unknown function (DUF3134) [Phormidesmis priestleyi Ana]
MSNYNPSVRQIPRDQPADVIPLQQDSSILNWLEGTGRLIAREPIDSIGDEPEPEELADLMGNEDKDDDVDDDDEMSLDDDVDDVDDDID